MDSTIETPLDVLSRAASMVETSDKSGKFVIYSLAGFTCIDLVPRGRKGLHCVLVPVGIPNIWLRSTNSISITTAFTTRSCHFYCILLILNVEVYVFMKAKP